MEKKYTQKEVDELIIKARIAERDRARKIAYEFMEENRKSFESKKKAGNDLAFIKYDISEECRYIGNAISGGNALSAALNETMEDRIRKEYAESMPQKNIEIVSEHEGLKCDNSSCDWIDETIKREDMAQWVDKSCPKCGENVLTKHDFELHEKLLKSIDFINTLSEEQIDELTKSVDPAKLQELFNNPGDLEKLMQGGEFLVNVSMHKDIKIDVKKS